MFELNLTQSALTSPKTSDAPLSEFTGLSQSQTLHFLNDLWDSCLDSTMDAFQMVERMHRRHLFLLELMIGAQTCIDRRARRRRRRMPRPNYTQTPWYRLINHQDIENVQSRQHKYFRRRFRVPYASVSRSSTASFR